MVIPLMVVVAAVAATWLCKILRIYLLNRIVLLLVREEIIKVTVVLHHLIHYCQQTAVVRETPIYRTAVLVAVVETLVQAHVGAETVNTVVAVVAIADTEALVVMGATAVCTAVVAVAALVTQMKYRAVMVVQDETVRLKVVKVTEVCLAVAEAVIQLRDKMQPRYKEEMVVMAWIHAEWAWNLKGKDSVAQASNFLNMEALAVAEEATAEAAEVLKRVAVEVLAVVAMAQKAETMTQVDKVVLVVAAVMAAMEATVVILITQAAVLVVAEDMA